MKQPPDMGTRQDHVSSMAEWLGMGNTPAHSVQLNRPKVLLQAIQFRP